MSSSDAHAQTTVDRQRLYRLTTGILNTYSFHFITISILFIPFTFFASATVQFYLSSSPDTTDVTTMFDPFNLILIKTIISSFQNNLLTFETLITLFTYICFVIVPATAGVALIIYNTNQAIHGKPITFSSTLKSLSCSYIPLLYTFIMGSIKIIIILLVFTLSPLVLTEAIKALGFHFDLLIFSVFVNTSVSYALAATILFFVVVWGSSAAITVLELKSGLESLRQSANQSTGFRRHSLSIVLLTGYAMCIILPSSATIFQISGPKANWLLILYVAVGAKYMLASLMFLFYMVANTVLYVQNKVATGEEIATKTMKGEVSDEYVKLAENDNDGEVVDEVVKEEAWGTFTYMLYVLSIVWIILLSASFLYDFVKKVIFDIFFV